MIPANYFDMSTNELFEAWGGPWTTKKLNAFEKYVKAYLKIIKNQPQWKSIYFDGFAGSGQRRSKSDNPLFAGLNLLEEETNLYKGAAERLVNMGTPYVFNFYYFIEKSVESKEKLKSKLEALPASKNKKLEFREGDCNQEIMKLSKALKTNQFAALVFLDPFGMQIDWESISSLHGTRSDIWILIPTAVIVNRLLDKDGKLKNLKNLESFFGLSEAEIRNIFYPKTELTDIFGNPVSLTQKVLDPINKIAQVYCTNLEKLWKYVSKPLMLENRSGAPLFHFVFASNNEKAHKIAESIIKSS